MTSTTSRVKPKPLLVSIAAKFQRLTDYFGAKQQINANHNMLPEVFSELDSHGFSWLFSWFSRNCDLYVHQRQAFEVCDQSANVVVPWATATATAAGQSDLRAAQFVAGFHGKPMELHLRQPDTLEQNGGKTTFWKGRLFGNSANPIIRNNLLGLTCVFHLDLQSEFTVVLFGMTSMISFPHPQALVLQRTGLLSLSCDLRK